MSGNTFPRPIDPSEIREGDLIRAEHGDQAREDRVRFVWQDAIDALRTAAAGFPSGTRGRSDMREVADYLESLAAAEGRGERS